MTESRTFDRLSTFPERPIELDDFPEQMPYSRNGRHVCSNDDISIKNKKPNKMKSSVTALNKKGGTR